MHLRLPKRERCGVLTPLLKIEFTLVTPLSSQLYSLKQALSNFSHSLSNFRHRNRGVHRDINAIGGATRGFLQQCIRDGGKLKLCSHTVLELYHRRVKFELTVFAGGRKSEEEQTRSAQ